MDPKKLSPCYLVSRVSWCPQLVNIMVWAPRIRSPCALSRLGFSKLSPCQNGSPKRQFKPILSRKQSSFPEALLEMVCSLFIVSVGLFYQWLLSGSFINIIFCYINYYHLQFMKVTSELCWWSPCMSSPSTLLRTSSSMTRCHLSTSRGASGRITSWNHPTTGSGKQVCMVGPIYCGPWVFCDSHELENALPSFLENNWPWKPLKR